MSYQTGKWNSAGALKRVEGYLNELESSIGLDHEMIHSFHLGCGSREKVLRVADLRILLFKAQGYDRITKP